VKIPETFSIKPLPKRLRNTLFSLLFCFGLIVAYYATTGNQPLPPDTHITYESTGVFRLDIDANGHVRLTDQRGLYTYKISKFAVRRTLRTFHQVDFFGRDILAYGGTPATCQLTLIKDHQKAAIRYDCKTQAMELRKPVETLNQVTRYQNILKNDKTVIRDYGVIFSPKN
jgi:hypothetical protein